MLLMGQWTNSALLILNQWTYTIFQYHIYIKFKPKEFISKINGNKEIQVKGNDFDANPTKMTNNMKWAVPRRPKTW